MSGYAVQPMNGAMSPEEILQMNYRNQQAITDQNGAAMNEIAKAAYLERARRANLEQEHKNALASIEAHLKGQREMQQDKNLSDLEMESLREQAATVRGREHIAALKALDEGRDARARAGKEADDLDNLTTRLITGKGVVPQYSEGDTYNEKRKKLVDALVKNQEYQEALQTGNGEAVLKYHENNLSDLRGRLSSLKRYEDARKLAVANSVAADKIYNELDDKQRAAVDKKLKAGMTKAQALGTIPTLANAYREEIDMRLKLIPDSRDYLESSSHLSNEVGRVASDRDRLASSPAGQAAMLARAKAARDDAQRSEVVSLANAYGPMAPVLNGGHMLGIESGGSNASGVANVANALGAAAGEAKLTPNGGYIPGATMALSDPGVQEILNAHHKNWGEEGGDVIRATSSRIDEAQRKLREQFNSLGVTVGADGKIIVPEYEPDLGASENYSAMKPIGQLERNRRLDKAVALRNQIRDLDGKQRKLFMAQAAEAHAKNAMAPSPSDVLSATAAAAPQDQGFTVPAQDILGLPAHTFPAYNSDARRFDYGGGDVIGMGWKSIPDGVYRTDQKWSPLGRALIPDVVFRGSSPYPPQPSPVEPQSVFQY